MMADSDRQLDDPVALAWAAEIFRRALGRKAEGHVEEGDAA